MHWVNDYIGIPWREGGRTRQGCDCYGLCRLVLWEQFGVKLDAHDQFYTSIKDSTSEIAQTIRTQLAHWTPVPSRHEARPGDVAILAIGGVSLHCAVVVNSEVFLHVRHTANAITTVFTDVMWAKRLEGLYRYA